MTYRYVPETKALREVLPTLRKASELIDAMAQQAEGGQAGTDVDNLADLQLAMARLERSWSQLIINLHT